MKQLPRLLILFFSCAISACASHELVRPGHKGIHAVTTYGDDDELRGSMAIDQAKDYCMKVENSPNAYILSEKSFYKGKMKESTYRSMKTAGKIGMGVGTGAMVIGGKNEANTGKVLTLAGLGATLAADGTYCTEMKFTCQSRLTAKKESPH